MHSAVAPLGQFLETITKRLDHIEAQLGITREGTCEVSTLIPPASSSLSLTNKKPLMTNPTLSKAVAGSATTTCEMSPSILAYRNYLEKYLERFLKASENLAIAELDKLSLLVKQGFERLEGILAMTSSCQPPATSSHDTQLPPNYIQPLLNLIKEINSLRDSKSLYANHQNMIHEGIQSLAWPIVDMPPKVYIESYIGGVDFWGNKIRQEYKVKDTKQIDYVSTFKELLVQLLKYVKEYHVKGVTWNQQGIAIEEYNSMKGNSTAGSSGQGQASVMKEQGDEKKSKESAIASTSRDAAGGIGGIRSVFDQINKIDQSSGKTSGLKHVTKEMKAKQKDGPLPTPSSIEEKIQTTSKSPSKPANESSLPPPKCEQRDGNWFIENQHNLSQPLVLESLQMKQQVYLFKCENSTISLNGKCKNIVMDQCKNSFLVFDNAVSSIEIVNCKRVRIQCKEKVPSIAIDKTDGCLICLSYEGRDVHLVTSKSSEMNVSFPKAAGDDYMIEIPIPEQFVHKITAENKVVSTVSDLYS